MEIYVPCAFICHFLAERFCTLKFELDFYSRQGHWTLSRTGVYYNILLKKTNDGRVSSALKKMRIMSFFVVSLCWNIFPSFLHRKEINISLKRCCEDVKHRLLKQKKKQKNCKRTIVVGTLQQSWVFILVLCICILL